MTVKPRTIRALIAGLLLAMPWAAGAHSIAADEGFVPRPTCKTTASGPYANPGTWSCGRVPTGSDWVQIDHAVTLSSSITVWTLYVSPAGSLTNAGTGLTITISDTAPADAPQFDTGIIVEGAITLVGTPKTAWTTTTAGIAAGATSVTIKDCGGWATGDRLVFGDSREIIAYPIAYDPEVRSIAGLSGCTITLDRPLGHAYTTARDHDGVVERTIPVGNLSRDITIRSATASGHRGHLMITGMGKADLQYVRIADMGRTTIKPLNAVTNHLGRYAYHLHHLMMPGAATATGVVVDGYTKWGYTVHASNGNTLQDVIAYNGDGAGVMTEDGTEEGNVFRHSLVIGVSGGGAFDNGASHPGGPGSNGTGFWVEGPRNILVGNVAMNTEESGFAIYERQQDSPRVMAEFRDNESIATTYGITFWSVGSETLPSLVDHFMEWHNTVTGLYDYGSRKLVLDRFYSRSDPNFSSKAGTRSLGKYNWFGDYDPGFLTTFTRSDIQNKDAGLYLPYGVATPTAGAGERVVTVTDGYFYNSVDVLVQATVGSAGQQPVRAEIVNPTHGNAAGTHYAKEFTGMGDLTLTHHLLVRNYQKVAGDDFEVFGLSQDPAFMMPPTGSGVTGCPVAGMTNQQCRSAHGVSIYGELMPAGAVPRANIVGKVLAKGARPASSAAATQATPARVTATPARVTPPSSRATATSPLASPLPTTGDGVRSQADYSALPVCATFGTTVDAVGHHWTIEPPPSFKLLADGASFMGGRGFTYLATGDGLFVISTTGRSYRLVSFDGGWQVIDPVEVGCRLPPSPSGATVLQQNGYLVDDLGGVWIATCSYFTFATYCPDFEGTTIEPGIILRNGVRLGSGLLNSSGQLQGMGGIRSEPEPNNSPWNLKWCGGEMYMHNYDSAHALDQSQPLVKQFSRWQGRAVYEWAPATESDCGSGTPATTLTPPTNVRIVRDN